MACFVTPVEAFGKIVFPTQRVRLTEGLTL